MYDEDIKFGQSKKKEQKEKKRFFTTQESSPTKEETFEKEHTDPLMKLDFDVKKVLKKLGIFVGIAFFVIFVSTKLSNSAETKRMEESLDIIKNGAYKYFKENDRPVVPDEEYVISLQDLIDDNYVSPIKDQKGNLCNASKSEIIISKKSSTKYNLLASIDCNNHRKEKDYVLTYSNTGISSKENNVFYKLQKEVITNNYTYSCKDGYVLDGKYCYSGASTLTANPIAKYKTISAKVKKASYKKVEDILEYESPVEYTTNTTYSCKNSNDVLVGNQCMRQKAYSISSTCPSSYKKDGNRCYYKTYAESNWTSWSFIGEVTSRTKKTTTDSDKYDYLETIYKNGKKQYVYNHFVRYKKLSCPSKSGESVELKGSMCYHYTNLVESKTCSSGYTLNKEGSACVRYTPANIKPSKTSLVCPTGYEQKKNGSQIECYRKIPQEGYYYCKDEGYHLDGTNCVRDASTELIGYKCPSGYHLNGTQCVKVLSGNKIAAIKTNDPDIGITYKWSNKKSLSGWTWTGETKKLDDIET